MIRARAVEVLGLWVRFMEGSADFLKALPPSLGRLQQLRKLQVQSRPELINMYHDEGVRYDGRFSLQSIEGLAGLCSLQELVLDGTSVGAGSDIALIHGLVSPYPAIMPALRSLVALTKLNLSDTQLCQFPSSLEALVNRANPPVSYLD